VTVRRLPVEWGRASPPGTFRVTLVCADESVMRKYVLSCSLVVASFLLGWGFLALGRAWFLAYVVFGGALIMSLLAVLD